MIAACSVGFSGCAITVHSDATRVTASETTIIIVIDDVAANKAPTGDSNCNNNQLSMVIVYFFQVSFQFVFKLVVSTMCCRLRHCATLSLIALFVLSALHLTAFVTLHDVQYSWWFDFNAYKSRLEREYLRELALSDAAIERSLRRDVPWVNANASLCIAVATTHREGRQYVRVLLGSWLRGTPRPQRDDAIIHLVSTGNSSNADIEQLAQLAGVQIQRLFPTVNATALDHIAWVDLQLKSILFTMQFCVEHAQRVGSRYFVLLEDDGILADNFVDRVHDAVGTLDVDDPNWFVIKLFLSDYFSGFESHDALWILPLCVVLPLAVYIVARCLLHRTVAHAQIAATITLIVFVCVIGVGRQNLVPWKRGLTRVTAHFSMCAHIYSTQHARNFIAAAMPLIDGSSLGKDEPPDSALNTFVTKSNLTMYNYVPNLYQHIGFWSSCTRGSCVRSGKIQGDPRTMKQSSTFERVDNRGRRW